MHSHKTCKEKNPKQEWGESSSELEEYLTIVFKWETPPQTACFHALFHERNDSASWRERECTISRLRNQASLFVT